MRVVLVGGGSGGHVTPLRAIVRSLRSGRSDVQATVVADRSFFVQTEFLFRNEEGVRLRKIHSGKLRRYASKSFLWHLVHLPTLLKNAADVFLLAIGLLQSIAFLVAHRPDVVFCKGGYVCVPVGVAARLLRIPLVIHDSDTHPGLTNRILSRWATTIGTGMPTKYYQYPKKKMRYTGIPVGELFTPADSATQKKAKRVLGFRASQPLLLVTGGGTGAAALNHTLAKAAPRLIEAGWQIMQLTGKGKAREAQMTHAALDAEQQRAWKIEEFAEISPIVQAADLIVSRAGATAMQEFANSKKAVIVIPSPHLSGNHQVKNAEMFAEHDAAVVLQESDIAADPELLTDTVLQLESEVTRMNQLATRLYTDFAKPMASESIATIIEQQAAEN